MKKSVFFIALLASISLVFTACIPSTDTGIDTGDTRPRVLVFDAPRDMQLSGLKRMLNSAIANPEQYRLLSTVRSDYHESNGSISSSVAEYYGSVALRRTDADLGVFVYAPVLEQHIHKHHRDKDGKERRLVATKLQLEAFILDPVTEQRIATYTTDIFRTLRVEHVSEELIAVEEDADVWRMAKVGISDLAGIIARDLALSFNK